MKWPSRTLLARVCLPHSVAELRLCAKRTGGAARQAKHWATFPAYTVMRVQLASVGKGDSNWQQVSACMSFLHMHHPSSLCAFLFL